MINIMIDALKESLRSRYREIQNTSDPQRRVELHLKYMGFQDASIIAGVNPHEIARMEEKIIAESDVTQLNDDGTEIDDTLSDEERQQLEEEMAAFGKNPFREDEIGGLPTQ